MAHSHGYTPGDNSVKLFISVILNGMIVVFQIIAGLMANSLGLLGDAVHNLSDVVALLLSWRTEKLTATPATPQRTFGLRRLEVFTAFINAAALLAISGWISYEAVLRFLHPETVNGGIVIIAALLGLLVNVGSALLLRNRSNMNVRSAFLHLVSDAAASLGVLVAGVLITLFHWNFMDPLISLCVAIWMIVESWKLIRESVHILLEGTPAELEFQQVKDAMLELAGVLDVHELHLWSISSTEFALSTHIRVDDAAISDTAVIIDNLKKMLHDRFGVEHSTLELECSEGGCSGICSC